MFSINLYLWNPTSFNTLKCKWKLLSHVWLCNPMDYTGQTIGVGSLSHLQGSSQPRDRTQVSHTVRGFFTRWATGEALKPLTVFSQDIQHMGYSVNHIFLDVFWRFLICCNMSVPGTLTVLLVSPFTGWWFLLLPVKMSLFLLYIQLILWEGIKFKTGNHSL